MTFRQQLALWSGIVMIGLLLLGSQLPAAQAGTPPPRATLTPSPMPLPTLTPTPVSSTGTYIELRLPTDNINLWTVVQWQDGVGNWHDVEGWRGTLDFINDHKGDKVWWVLPYSYGDGPCRWLVYDHPDGNILATSHSFYLPGADRHVVVEVVLR
jgi:hypothetical protein